MPLAREGGEHERGIPPLSRGGGGEGGGGEGVSPREILNF